MRSMRHAPAGAARFLTIGTSLYALAMTGAAPAFAQATTSVPDPAASSQTAANPNEAGSEQEDIVVTGFRRALETAVAAKRERDQIVESVSAEDIGKLPDTSIAEAIARLPGLAAQRVSGRAQTISVRGLGPDFSTTLLNGREQTSTSDTRSVEFDQYPAEVMNQVLVYKSPMASLVGQGLVGTVDLRTVRPIEFGRRVVSVGGRGTYTDLGKLNPDSEEFGYRVTGTYIDQFLDDRLGVALSASYINEPYQIEEFNAWGFTGLGPGGAQVIGGEKSYVTSTTLERIGLSGTVEFRPVPEFTSTIDAFYSDFRDDQTRRGIELPLGFGVNDFFGTTYNPATSTVTDGVVTAGQFQNVQAIVRNDALNRTADLYSFGWNNAYRGQDGWNVTLDLSYSRTDRSELSVESYAGTGRGRARGATDTIDFTTGRRGSRFTGRLNYADPALFLLTDPAGYGGDGTNQTGYFNDRRTRDEIQQYRLEVEKEIDGFPLSSIQFGTNYTRRKKSLTPDEAFVTIPGTAQELAVPSQYLLDPVDLSSIGLGSSLAYDPFELIDEGVLLLIPRGDAFDVLSKAYSIREDIMTGYLQGNIRQDIGTAVLTGNAGVQVVVTEQKTTGLVNAPTGFLTRTFGADYVDVLPSANLSLRTASDFVIRVAGSRQVVRPRLDDMRLALSYGVDTSGDVPIIRGSAGNPALRPYRANAVDLTAEKYFGRSGYIAVQGFYKFLESYIFRSQETAFDYAGFPLQPGAIVPPSTIGTITRPVNVDGGRLYGVEVAGTLPIGEFIGALDGFGITGGASYTETSIPPDPATGLDEIPGYSKWVANGTAYFEKWGFSARGSVRYRSSFIGELTGFGGGRTNRVARDELIVDAQIGYDITGGMLNGLSLFVQGQNLTDEPFVTQASDDTPLQVIDYQRYGRRFLAGFTAKF